MKTSASIERTIIPRGAIPVLLLSMVLTHANGYASSISSDQDSTIHISRNCLAAANDLTWTALGLNDQQVHFMKDLQLRYTKLEDQSDYNVQKGIPDTEVRSRQNMYTSAPTSTTGAGRNTKVTNEDTTGRQNSTVHGNDAGIKGSTMTTIVPTVSSTAQDEPPLQLELSQILSEAQLRKWRSICEE